MQRAERTCFLWYGTFKSFFSALPDVDVHNLIIGGGFHCVHSPELDRSTAEPGLLSKTAKVILNYTEQYRLFKPWRFNFPTWKAFLFSSPVHSTYSQMDYILLDTRLIPATDRITYHSIVISDHAPLSFEMPFPESFPWHLNSLSLSDSKFTKIVSTQIKFFIETNATPNISHGTLWETFKAFLCGQIFCFTSHSTKESISQFKLRLSSFFMDGQMRLCLKVGHQEYNWPAK